MAVCPSGARGVALRETWGKLDQATDQLRAKDRNFKVRILHGLPRRRASLQEVGAPLQASTERTVKKC
jgi:hypothetical protein